MSADNLMSQAKDLRARANRMRELAKYGNGQDFKDEMAEAQRLSNEADYLEGLEKQDGNEAFTDAEREAKAEDIIFVAEALMHGR